MLLNRFSPFLLMSTFAHGAVGACCLYMSFEAPVHEQVIVVDIVHGGELSEQSSAVVPPPEVKPVIPPPQKAPVKEVKIKQKIQTHESGDYQVAKQEERARLDVSRLAETTQQSHGLPSSGSGSLDTKVRATYAQLLLHRLEERKRYPRIARRMHAEGVTTIQISIDKSGNLVSKKLVQSSGHEVLDEEVLALAERAAPYPPLPTDSPTSSVQFEIPIAFKLI